VLARVGGFVVPWRLKASGLYGVVAGRLDGHLVGAAWPIAEMLGLDEHSHSCLPALAPVTWDVARPWPYSTTPDADEAPPVLGLGLDVAGGPASRDNADAMIEQLVVWRDILHRPAADGVVEWRVESGNFFLLGDFPSGSRDSRHWGPLGGSTLGNLAVPVARTKDSLLKRL
jgi:hypothetical protein